MRKISAQQITKTTQLLAKSANLEIDQRVSQQIEQAIPKETSPVAKETLEIILQNHQLAREKQMPLCQDTGTAVVFVEIGQEVTITGGNITDAINKGIATAYKESYFRKSIVNDALIDRKNTGNNTPAIIHYDIVGGDKLKITVAPKGGGAENMSKIKMMKPADGLSGIKSFVLSSVQEACGNPCPPIILGIGIGGNFEQSAILAKKALLKDRPNSDSELAKIEHNFLQAINQLGIGPMGLGGKTTALSVKINMAPCHIASLPVAINFQCHCHRHKTAIL